MTTENTPNEFEELFDDAVQAEADKAIEDATMDDVSLKQDYASTGFQEAPITEEDLANEKASLEEFPQEVEE